MSDENKQIISAIEKLARQTADGFSGVDQKINENTDEITREFNGLKMEFNGLKDETRAGFASLSGDISSIQRDIEKLNDRISETGGYAPEIDLLRERVAMLEEKIRDYNQPRMMAA